MGLIARLAREYRFLKDLFRTLGRVKSIGRDSANLICDDLEAAVDGWPEREALVVVRYTVKADGSTADVEVVDGFSNGLFDSAAVDTVEDPGWRCIPPGGRRIPFGLDPAADVGATAVHLGAAGSDFRIERSDGRLPGTARHRAGPHPVFPRRPAAG